MRIQWGKRGYGILNGSQFALNSVSENYKWNDIHKWRAHREGAIILAFDVGRRRVS